MSKCFCGTRLGGSRLATGGALAPALRRALHSTGSGAGARTAETQLRASAGCSAATGLPWLPRGGPPPAPARPSAFCPQKRGTERDVLLPRLARLPCAGLGAGDSGGGKLGVPNPPGTAAAGRPVPAPRGALS